jgi:ribosome maturation factor RimP
MITTHDIQPIVDRFIAGTDFFLVSLKAGADNVVEVVIDSPQGVNLDQCVELSNAINAAFDRDVEDFELTVSSAGLEQPFRVLPQYLKYLGKEVEVVLKAGKKLAATLTEATPDTITVQYEMLQKVAEKKRKQPITVTATYLLTEIKSTKPIIQWKD